MTSTISELWSQLERWLELNTHSLGDRLNAGVSRERIVQFEGELGMELNSEFADFYMRHNGEHSLDGSEFGFPGSFLSLERVLESHQSLAEPALESEEDGFKVEGPVRDCAFHLLWIPIFGADGDYVCLDFAPTSGGTRGQLIRVTHDGERRLIASGLASWLESHLARFQQGKIRYDADTQCLEWD